MVKVGETVPISTVDWHGHCCTTIFLAGCPFRCVYCSNHNLITGEGAIDVPMEELKEQIARARDFIDGVVLSGGEPTMNKDVMTELLLYSKSIGLKTAIQTNGYYPENLKTAIDGRMVDAIMFDMKARICGKKYSRVVGYDDMDVNRIVESARICSDARSQGQIEYLETRTVVFWGINDTAKELTLTSNMFTACDAFVIVQGMANISPADSGLSEVPIDEINKLATEILLTPIPSLPVWVRSRTGEVRIKRDSINDTAAGR